MLSRLVLSGSLTATVRGACKSAPMRVQFVRGLQRDSREAFKTSRTVRGPTLKERLMAPAGPNAFKLGKGALAGGSAVGLGALCFYGIGMGKGISVMDNSMLWPQYVKDRINATYLYFGGSCIISAASAVAVFRTPALINLVSRGGFIPMMATIAVMIGSGMVARAIPYQPGLGAKQLAWATHCAIIGAVIAPLCYMGGPIMMRAAMYTAGVVGGLSTVAVCAPSDKFLYIGGPLAIGFGAVFAASMAGMFFPATTALGAGLYSLSMYGGLLLFSGFLLYDTQRIVRNAENHSPYAAQPYDPVNASISIYMDTINIFIRIASILGGQRRN